MPNRIDGTFKKLRAENRAAFIPYICAGDPTLADTERLAAALVAAGADVLELGVPFSDPLADGVVNQRASQRALEGGADVRGVLQTVRDIRTKTQTPIVLYTYMNPIFQFGWDKFHGAASKSGVDALLILDLPADEEFEPHAEVHHIRLIAPTTSPDRIRKIVQNARGFLYYVSREGVTGAGGIAQSNVGENVAAIRGQTSLPIAVGFGISTADQARATAQFADGVVVGSALVAQIEQNLSAPDMPARVGKFATELASAVHSASSPKSLTP